MRSLLSLLIATMALAACQGHAPSEGDVRAASRQAESRWEMAVDGGDVVARLIGADGLPVMSIACLAGTGELSVHVPGFTRIPSEDRLSIGFGDDSIALAVDLRSPVPGVTGSQTLSRDILAQIRSASMIGALYGTQFTGLHPAPDAADVERWAGSCAGTIE
ncbi:hypothetical protein [Telmatospirillum sp. J64-1]|uniref:hypothetical protein n=1 Tax=Telmatospirillum sp. J64-1 TaxID=2502183 RepID=UPI00115E0DD3|nr:hypothetical protein [Telmatospirillum sp. J64-1]